MLSANAKAMGCTSASVSPTASSTGSTRWAIAGSAIAPSRRLHTVMPSWLTPMTREMFSIAERVMRAIREPACARGSIWLRRAEISANSAPTKNALPSSSNPASTSPVRLPIGALLVLLAHRDRQPVEAQPVHAVDAQDADPAHDRPLLTLLERHGQLHLGLVASLRDPAELLHDQSRDGVVVVVLGQRDARDVLGLVGSQQ